MASAAPVPLLAASLRDSFRHLGLRLATQGVLLAASVLLLLAALLLADGMSEGERLVRLLDGQQVPLFPSEPGALALSVTLGTLSALLGVAGLGMGVLVAQGIGLGQPPRAGEAWRALGRRLPNLVGTFLFTGIAMGLLVGFVGGIASLFSLVASLVVAFVASTLLGYLWVFSVPASVLERNSPLRNLGRSIDLGARCSALAAAATALGVLVDGIPAWLAVGAVLALDAHVGGAEPTLLMDLGLWGAGALVAFVGGLVLSTFLAGAYRAAAEADLAAQPAPPAAEAGGPDAAP